MMEIGVMTDGMVARLRRIAGDMQAEIRERGGAAAKGRRLTLAEVARADPAFAPSDHFGARLTERYPHLGWLDRPRQEDRPSASEVSVAA